MAEVFGWCVECGRFVGRACCWGPGQSCTRCADARAASGDAGSGFAALGAARAAVRQMDGTVAEFAAVEDAVARAGGADTATAFDAWGGTWLAAGWLRTRIDSSREAARSWLRLIPPAEVERTAELEDELGVVAASLRARWGSLTRVIADAGAGLARREARRRPLGPTALGSEPTPRPVAAVAASVPLPIRPPDRITVRVATTTREAAPATPTARPTTAETRTPTTAAVLAPPKAAVVRPTLRRSSSASVARPPPAQRQVGIPRAHPDAAPAPERVRTEPARPEQAQTERAQSGPAAVAVPAQREPARPEPSVAGNGARRRRTVTAALIVGVGLVLGGVLLAGTIGPLARDSDGVPDREADLPAGAVGEGGSAASLAASTPSSPPRSRSTFVTFDLHPVGLLDPEEVPITRIIGAPEVAPFPTPFDRSLRLVGEAAGVCIEHASPSQADAPSMAFDLHLGEAGAGGTLAFALPATGDGPAVGLALDLAMLDQLDRDSWYRLTVTGADQGGRLEVTPVGGDRPTLGVELGVDPTIVPTSTDELCIQSALKASEASVFVDNLRADR